MSQLIFAQAKSIRKKALKAFREAGDLGGILHDEEIGILAYNKTIEKERKEFIEILKIAKLLHDDYTEITNNTTKNWYFISIRPKEETTFEELYKLTYKFINRACIIHYFISFEQKSTNGDGKGIHVHIVANTKHRSKGECLRDTTSTFNSIAADNCIDIKPTKNPNNIVNNYLINYQSDDNHKIITQEGDKIWRQRIGIDAIYTNTNYNNYSPLPNKSFTHCLSSPQTVCENIITFD